jgi:hypothetical protein
MTVIEVPVRCVRSIWDGTRSSRAVGSTGRQEMDRLAHLSVSQARRSSMTIILGRGSAGGGRRRARLLAAGGCWGWGGWAPAGCGCCCRDG